MKNDWNWYAGRDEETFSVGPCADREEAIQQGKDYFDEDGFFIVEATKAVWAPPVADRIITDMLENSDDLFSEDYPELTGTVEQQMLAESELQRLLDEWMDKYRDIIFPTPWAFAASRNAEYIPGVSDD